MPVEGTQSFKQLYFHVLADIPFKVAFGFEGSVKSGAGNIECVRLIEGRVKPRNKIAKINKAIKFD